MKKNDMGVELSIREINKHYTSHRTTGLWVVRVFTKTKGFIPAGMFINGKTTGSLAVFPTKVLAERYVRFMQVFSPRANWNIQKIELGGVVS